MTNNLLKKLVISGAVATAVLTSGCSKKPFKLDDVALGGNMYRDGQTICVFYDKEGNRTPAVNESRFDQAAAYDANGPARQGNYDVYGYIFRGEKIATQIVADYAK